MRYQRAELPLTIDGLAAARSFFAGCIADSGPNREHLFVAHLDDQSRCVHLSRHAGDETGAHFPLREIVADAAAHGSAGIVLAHNHPSGDARPSDADKRVTRRLAAVADALDCAVLDHLVFGGRDVSSLRQLGYL
jgi:DNA repair protein RadC